METSTRLFVNNVMQTSTKIGILRSGDVVRFEITCPSVSIPLYSTADGIRVRVIAGASNPEIGLTSDTTTYVVEMDSKALFTGTRIPLHLVEKLGNGALNLHTFGLTRVGIRWHFRKATQHVQFFIEGTKYVTPNFVDERLLKTITPLVWNDDVEEIESLTPINVEPGTVKWFDQYRLIGAIAGGEDGDVLFHLNDIRVGIFNREAYYWEDAWTRDHFDPIFPKVGQQVRYEAHPTSEGNFSRKADWVVW